MYADVVLQVQNRANALLIPVQALNHTDSGLSVFVVDKDNRVQVRDIHTGLESPNKVEVTAGLQEGDRVIVGNLASYHAGEIVAPKSTSLAVAELDGGMQ
jgi:multidrug efflux pump subunit AcrA (membrane-fusion protein)